MTSLPAAGPSPDDAMRPVLQTRDALALLGEPQGAELERSLAELAGRVRRTCPDCIALSLTLWGSGLTFTVVTEDRAAGLADAVLYLDGAGDEDADGAVVPLDAPAPVVEDRWRDLASSGERLGIASSLTLPVLEGDDVVAGVDLYGATVDAFEGRHDVLAAICGSWDDGAITNADLGFTSRVRAAATPDRLLEQREVDLAVGVVAEHQRVDEDEAAQRMTSAAVRAGVSTVDFARFVLDAHDEGLAGNAEA